MLAGDWQGASKPALLGQEFDTIQPGNRYGLPKGYALHAWIWKPNPGEAAAAATSPGPGPT